MLDSVKEAITATAVNKRGHVDIVSLHRKDGATQMLKAKRRSAGIPFEVAREKLGI